MSRTDWIGEAMKIAHEDLEKEKMGELIPFPTTVTGPQPAGQPPSSKNWLKDLEVGTYFLVVRQTETFLMEGAEAEVYSQAGDWTCLEFHMPTHSFHMWLFNENYCAMYKCAKILRLP